MQDTEDSRKAPVEAESHPKVEIGWILEGDLPAGERDKLTQ